METSAVSDSSSVPVLLPFFSVFLLSYLIAYFIVFRNWSPKIRPEASSCFISLLHGTPAVFLASFAILKDSNRGFDGLNTTFQKMVLDYSIAYFLMDLLHYIVFVPSDVLFIAHHLATLFVICTCRYVVSHGAFAILFLLILAEVTSLCQNVWTLAGTRKNDAQIAAKVYAFLSPPFYTLYSLVRGFGGPYFIYRMVAFYTSGLVDGRIPKWVWISWVVVVLTAIGVSIMWISNLWMELYRERTRKLEEKIR
ncbi:hypothetical protein QN277_013669 [Acacia crassicarpa]|uniref:TLC domain-containing protein n=1 Tax=Acacia crassicarpa TaxID=499986 RepID=A0AAE1TED9_9FABA|nr:hypothetical protein QN277_013669 [Acacia crassicarpa]